MRLFVFGLGYSALACLKRLDGRLESVSGTTRAPDKAAELARYPLELARPAPLPTDLGCCRDPLPYAQVGNTQLAVGRGWRRSDAAADLPSSAAAPTPPPCPSSTKGERTRSEHHGAADPTDADPPAESIEALVWDGGSRDPRIAAALAKATHVLVSIAPGAGGDPVLAHHGADLATLSPRSLVYLSTVGVYGDHDGAWVDETTPCRPVSRRSRERVVAETAWQEFARTTDVPVAILRLAGIYGPGRGPFEKLRAGTARRIVKPGQVFNRIHVDDIAAIVDAAFAHAADGVFNGADDEPAPPQEVTDYAAGLLGLPPPPEIDFEDADLSPMARSFYGENKRVRNDRIKRELGVALACPTYREGLQAVLRGEAQMRRG